MRRFCLAILGLVGLAIVIPGRNCAQDKDAAGHAFFESKIRPVLVNNCYECHSHDAKKNRGSLYLDSKAAMLEGGDTSPAIIPGKPKESLLLKAIRHEGELRMPPKAKLPDNVIADFEKWIAMGAPDPRDGKKVIASKGIDLEAGRKFWAYQPPVLPKIPLVKNNAWGVSPIDNFILARIEKEGLGNFPRADRRTLIRRASYALTGLPPSAEEVENFVKDGAADLDAFAKIIDRLLASPHFGERWGRHWLDIARFAESSGGGRTLMFKDAWRYRDYVIQAYNNDKPFDQFIIEQIAGDLLKAKTPEERRAILIATAFLLVGPHNYERQDKPLLEMDIIDEQIDTIGKAFLGQTIGCARCHDHKFDPIPTLDYYALAGIMKSTKFIVHDNVSKWMEVNLPGTGPEEATFAKHDAAVAALQARINSLKAESKKSGKVIDPVVAKKAIDPKELPGIVLDDTQAKVVGSWKHSVYTGHFVGKGYLYDDRAFKDTKTLTFQPEFTKSGMYEVRLAYVPGTNRADKVPIRIFHTDGDNTVYVNQQKTPPIDGYFISLGKYRFEKGDQWFVMVLTEKVNGHVIADAVQFLHDDDDDDDTPKKKIAKIDPRSAGSLPADKADPKEKTDILAQIKNLEAELKMLQLTGPKRPTAMAVTEGDKIGDFHVCIRGIVHNKGETAPRGFLQVATRGPMPKIPDKESGRLQLAKWIASPDNPLTARVYVNRLWHHLYGAGIVRTVDIFGKTGETPSHPELLDYLALRLIENGWSTKKMIRELMLTETYMQASEGSLGSKEGPGVRGKGLGAWYALAQKADPENRLLWRMNRHRLEAEAIRDTILVVAGTLDRTHYGPTIKPGTAAERDYVFTDTRRSVYTPIFRNKLLELFDVFDFADPNTCNGKRVASTVSTQALFLMNSPFVMDQAKAAAQKTLAGKGTDAELLDAAYQKSLGRHPTPAEAKLALAYLAKNSGTTAEQRLAAWERVHQVVFACVDFRYVD